MPAHRSGEFIPAHYHDVFENVDFAKGRETYLEQVPLPSYFATAAFGKCISFDASGQKVGRIDNGVRFADFCDGNPDMARKMQNGLESLFQDTHPGHVIHVKCYWPGYEGREMTLPVPVANHGRYITRSGLVCCIATAYHKLFEILAQSGARSSQPQFNLSNPANVLFQQFVIRDIFLSSDGSWMPRLGIMRIRR